jgi:cation diffusion facilitator family transporter
MKRRPVTTKRVLLTSLFVDVIDVVINVTVAIITGSVVMLAEAMEGLADLGAVSMLLIGFKRSQKRSNRRYPFGYGKEQYFWALMSTFLIIGVTASLSFYFGLQAFLNPEPVEYVVFAYVVLAFAVCTNGYALQLSLHKLAGQKSWRHLPKLFLESSSVAPKTTIVLDAMGTLAALFGLTSLIIYGITGNGRFDGIGAMSIGVMLFGLALVLIFTTKGWVTGRSAPIETEQLIREATLRSPEVLSVLDLRTMMLGSDKLLANMEIHLQDDLTTDEIEKIIDQIKRRVRKVVPNDVHVNVEPETPPKKRIAKKV